MKLVIATTNQGKMQEYKRMLSLLNFKILGISDVGFIDEIEEKGISFEENAKIKALAVSQFSKLSTLADDSGLVIDALNGAPGIYSARYGGMTLTNKERCKKILREMITVPFEKRDATFVTSIVCILYPNRILKTEGYLRGKISFELKGNGGFGYDCIMELPEYGCTVAELSNKEKDLLSHRSIALNKMINELKE